MFYIYGIALRVNRKSDRRAQVALQREFVKTA
jgi:hypothetical protein